MQSSSNPAPDRGADAGLASGTQRKLLRASAALLFVVAAVTAAFVIPQVAADTFAAATPGRAVPVLSFMAAFDAGAALMLLFAAGRTERRSRSANIGLGILAAVLVLQALAFTDAAFAYDGHGPQMHDVSLALLTCVAADLVVAGFVTAAVFMTPRRH